MSTRYVIEENDNYRITVGVKKLMPNNIIINKHFYYEKADGFDSMGTKRWKEINFSSEQKMICELYAEDKFNKLLEQGAFN